MKMLDDYFALQKKIYEYFGYVEDWKVIPLEDATDQYWKFFEGTGGSGEVVFAGSIKALKSGKGEHYSNVVYTQRFLPKWVYRTEDYTMISVDTQTDGNKFLQIFDNKKEVEDLTEEDLEF